MIETKEKEAVVVPEIPVLPKQPGHVKKFTKTCGLKIKCYGPSDYEAVLYTLPDADGWYACGRYRDVGFMAVSRMDAIKVGVAEATAYGFRIEKIEGL